MTSPSPRASGTTSPRASGTTFPGFADPVLDAQASFRAVLQAMSRPGQVQRVPDLPELPPGLSPAAAAVLLTLVDAETRLCLRAGPEAAAWVRFHCGAPLVTAGAAQFVLDREAALPALDPGTEEEPERGATLILEVASLTEGRGWRLTGPGIRDEHRLHVGGAPPGFLADWTANRARTPCGVDVILCAGDAIAALPRSVAIEEG
ncbi:phosphonate C-P lyase system protein PhnH [Falsiroseomonas tokyonensis]|uniref:Phosphonate C-P lyase system protein PhnH n=1 Tax=Falsiroseomonas tokyonensis TaxID=430521 RepID=A0ABV7BVJ0_9PROT|nr:phosphonate C-P lyase system protein PhnH [Falsiroseomonas tokyonensis]MBU8538187.1 phosphonate C-P lyase system protein PhnH [Falsiroseomonas tokyonensis]